jgi:hypothetical protein
MRSQYFVLGMALLMLPAAFATNFTAYEPGEAVAQPLSDFA